MSLRSQISRREPAMLNMQCPLFKETHNPLSAQKAGSEDGLQADALCTICMTKTMPSPPQTLKMPYIVNL